MKPSILVVDNFRGILKSIIAKIVVEVEKNLRIIVGHDSDTLLRCFLQEKEATSVDSQKL